MIAFKTRLLYGTGGAVAAAKEAAYTMFILLFYTQVLGLSGTVTGLIIAVSLIWDGVSDPLVGSLSDRLRSRFGRRHPFMALSILPLGLGFVGLFSPPQAVIDNSTLLAAWLLFWSLWVRTFVTTFTIPHLALSAEITTDYHDRTQVLGARMGLMFLFAVLLPAAALVLVFPEQNGIDGRFEQSRYPLYGMLSCAVVWVMATLSTVGTRHHIRPEAPRPGDDDGDRTTLLALMRDLWRTLGNRNFRLLIAYDVAATSAYGVISSLNMLVWTFFWEFSATQISIILSLPTLLAVLLAAVTLGPLGRRLSKQRLVQLSLLGLILNCLWLYPLQLFELLPADSDRLVFALNFIFMLLFMYLFMLRIVNSTSIVADLTDEHELDHGVRQEAGFFSMTNFVSKMATVAGPLYGGLALDIIGLETGMRPGEVPLETLHGLVYALGLGVIPPLLVALWIISRIRTSQAQVEAVQAKIAARRALAE
ncbi:MFS transporter [Haliea sp. E1-2-M8]|uniref:MFS transporter n=1 Tax=Haliea sp. E1-2-M8 TaxID=3064706 RepID=UPI00271AF6E9|nr:MFS transporter [Haliea sp. E1-2-M8]MDO8860280.1 MFS transporter [Haliea sp. E1-2-M8]